MILNIRDIIDLVTIENISIVGFMFLIVVYLAWWVRQLQKSMEALRAEHKKEIADLIASNDKKYEALMEKLMEQMEKHVKVYETAQSANNQFVQIIKDLKNV